MLVGKCLEPRGESCAVLLNLVDQKMEIQILHKMNKGRKVWFSCFLFPCSACATIPLIHNVGIYCNVSYCNVLPNF